jgi:pimeloyl-ACP methyl ester carboxylesterase
VQLRGTYLQGRRPDLPTLIWFSDLVEPVENFAPFFSNPEHKILDVRNVWLLNYRNMGDSDHHESFEMDDISDDIVRFMDKQKLTMATLGGHGFGAKVALATAINNMDRVTGVINLEGGPLDHRYYEAYQELDSYVQAASKFNIAKADYQSAVKFLETNIACAKWRSIFKQNLEDRGGSVTWKFNVDDLARNMRLRQPDVACWHESYGLWPGQALAIFAAHSRWVHLSTNTLAFYNVIPRLQGQFPSQNINTFADEWESPLNHWLHEGPDSEHVWTLSQRMMRWLRWQDGTNVMLADKTEAGWYYVPDRGFDTEQNTRHGEFNPEHVHHNYLYTQAYEQSRKARGVQGANPGQYLTKGKFSDESRW